MIDEIVVNNIALIKNAVLEPASGLTVLTGETGAGKTALISAAKLIMGARADSSMVRDGAENAQVQGRLFTNNPAAAPYRSAVDADEDSVGAKAGHDGEKASGTDACDIVGAPIAPASADEAAAELVITRKLNAEGRSRASINGSLASVAELSSLVGPLIDLCGQHEHQTLLKVSEHGRLLDSWASIDAQAGAAYREAFDRWSEADQTLETLREHTQASNAKLDEARFTAEQIGSANPREGEYEELQAYLSKAEHAESLARNSHGAAEALSGDSGALDALNSAIAMLDEAGRVDETLAEYAASLRETCFVVEDVARDMAAYCEDVEFDEATLARSQDRMGALTSLMHRFGPTMETVFARWNEAEDLLSLAESADDRIAAAEGAVAEAEEALAETAAVLNEERAKAAPLFAEAVGSVMDSLEMGGAALTVAVNPLERRSWTRSGSSTVTFEFKPGKSMQPRPLARIASGGEISRVMLAVKTVLGAKDGTETLIFDEVDAGVGGAVAHALASVLEDLAQTHQVIVITHLPQVAVLADKHYVVSKTDDDSPETLLAAVEGEDRVREIARMLSGDETEASLAHAREMLGRA